MTTPIAEFIEIAKTYRSPLRPGRDVEALKGVSFRVEAGEAFALLGPNRAGKTTLLKILLGLCRPTGGDARRLGRPLDDRETLTSVGYMHGNQAFPGYVTAAKLLDFYGSFSGIPRRVLREKIPALLERMGLADRAREPIARFSKGMIQRLALAQALLNAPDLLVLDEPMEGLDLNARNLLHQIVDEQRDEGKTVLIVSHALEEVAQVCDRAAVLVGGKLAHLGEIADLLQDPATGRERTMQDALAPFY